MRSHRPACIAYVKAVAYANVVELLGLDGPPLLKAHWKTMPPVRHGMSSL